MIAKLVKQGIEIGQIENKEMFFFILISYNAFKRRNEVNSSLTFLTCFQDYSKVN